MDKSESHCEGSVSQGNRLAHIRSRGNTRGSSNDLILDRGCQLSESQPISSDSGGVDRRGSQKSQVTSEDEQDLLATAAAGSHPSDCSPIEYPCHGLTLPTLPQPTCKSNSMPGSHQHRRLKIVLQQSVVSLIPYTPTSLTQIVLQQSVVSLIPYTPTSLTQIVLQQSVVSPIPYTPTSLTQSLSP